MSSQLFTPEDLLFADRLGRPEQIQDIIDDGLDGGYDDRISGLITLQAFGEPYHRLLANVMLTSWGNTVGFQTLIDWASNSAHVPWVEEAVVYDRISGADSAFEMLADALKTSFYCDETKALRILQIKAIKALLGIYQSHFFGRTLALAILRSQDVMRTVENDICAAIENSLIALSQDTPKTFDLGFQIASLLIPLARLNDQLAASYADKLILNYPENRRMLRESINALGEGSGPYTLVSLQRMETLGMPALDRDVKNAIARR